MMMMQTPFQMHTPGVENSFQVLNQQQSLSVPKATSQTSNHQVFYRLLPQALLTVQEKLTMICTVQRINTYV